eukprot:2714135-Rhodomonas_salina.1
MMSPPPRGQTQSSAPNIALVRVITVIVNVVHRGHRHHRRQRQNSRRRHHVGHLVDLREEEGDVGWDHLAGKKVHGVLVVLASALAQAPLHQQTAAPLVPAHLLLLLHYRPPPLEPSVPPARARLSSVFVMPLVPQCSCSCTSLSIHASFLVGSATQQ